MRKNIITSFFLLLFLSINFSGNCQPTSSGFGVTNWGMQTGINSPYKTSIAIDASGNKWIGSLFPGKGAVQKFDGSNWKLYNDTNGLPSKNVTSIAVNGNIVYVGTKKGIAKYFLFFLIFEV